MATVALSLSRTTAAIPETRLGALPSSSCSFRFRNVSHVVFLVSKIYQLT